MTMLTVASVPSVTDRSVSCRLYSPSSTSVMVSTVGLLLPRSTPVGTAVTSKPAVSSPSTSVSSFSVTSTVLLVPSAAAQVTISFTAS